MPANTPNRGYPYSIPGDPANVPGALQALAEAVDTDLAAIQTTIHSRPMFRVTASATQSMNLTDVVTLQFTDLESNVNNALVPVPALPGTLVRPSAGFWYFIATCSYHRDGSGLLSQWALSVFVGANQIGISSAHVNPPALESARTLSVSALFACDGNTDVSAQFSKISTAPPNPQSVPLYSRSLTGFRVAI